MKPELLLFSDVPFVCLPMGMAEEGIVRIGVVGDSDQVWRGPQRSMDENPSCQYIMVMVDNVDFLVPDGMAVDESVKWHCQTFFCVGQNGMARE